MTYILITGWTWFIGSHAVVQFAQAGYTPIIIDNFSNSSPRVLEWLETILGTQPIFVQWDIRDKALLEQIFSDYSIAGVIHFAALKAVGESCQKVDLYFDNNINGSINLYNTMIKYNVKKLVFSSSCTVYGAAPAPVDETYPTGSTTNPYGKSKWLGEELLKDYAQFGGLEVIALRYFNPLGAHTSGLIGEYITWVPANIFPYILKVLKGELKEVGIFGNDYPTADGTGVRDYIDIMDLIDGHIAAWKYLENNSQQGLFDAINLGTGKGVSVLELIQITEKISGMKVPYNVLPRREGDIASIYANANKAKALLGWEAKNDLAFSISNALHFYGITKDNTHNNVLRHNTSFIHKDA